VGAEGRQKTLMMEGQGEEFLILQEPRVEVVRRQTADVVCPLAIMDFELLINVPLLIHAARPWNPF